MTWCECCRDCCQQCGVLSFEPSIIGNWARQQLQHCATCAPLSALLLSTAVMVEPRPKEAVLWRACVVHAAALSFCKGLTSQLLLTRHPVYPVLCKSPHAHYQ
jgi:hypothetical protein